MDTIGFGLKHFKKYMPMMIVVEILGFIAIWVEMLLPLLSAILIDHCIMVSPITETSGGMFHFLLDGNHGEQQTFELFWNVALYFGLFVFLRVALVYARNLYHQHAGLAFETKLRQLTYHKLEELDSATISRYNSGELLQTLNQDTITFKELMSRILPYFFDSLFIIGSAVVLLAMQDARFVIVPLILAPFLAFALLNFRAKAKRNFQEIRACSSRMNLQVTENIEAVRVVRSFTNEELEKEKFEKGNMAFKEAQLKQIRLQSRFQFVFNAIRQLAYIGTVGVAGYLVIQGKMQVGFVAASASYVMKVMGGVTNLNNQMFQMQQQIVAGQKIRQFLDAESEIPDSKDSTLTSEKPHIKLEHASVSFGESDVLRDITVDIPYGKKLGIVGPTGGGKSVLLRSLIRMQDLSAGSMTVDGRDVKEYSLANLRRMYSYVFQDVFLFSNSIDANIAYSKPDVQEDAIVRAAWEAQAHNFITHLSDGYETVVGERGLGISGGQKQRVSIARALLKNAPVLVLDDSTSALDVGTEHKLLETIRDRYPGKTLIITAHRLSSVEGCDEILYLEDGRITERGTFEELMKLDGRFARIYEIQQKSDGKAINFDMLAEKVALQGSAQA